MRQYIGFVRDHSGSMGNLAHKAMQDFNSLIEALRDSFKSMDTRVSVVECGSAYNGGVEIVNENQVLSSIIRLYNYPTPGGRTPLFDSVGKLIDVMDARYKLDVQQGLARDDAAFLLIILTDGQENASRVWYASNLRTQINRLQATDKWTIVFRVPKGYKTELVKKLGVHEGNVVEWDQTEAGFTQLTSQTNDAIKNYSQIRASGGTSTGRFYADTANLSKTVVQRNLLNISHQVMFYPVNNSTGVMIRNYVESISNIPYILGLWYYQLTKTETIQANKKIIIHNKINGNTYTGDDAKSVLSLPIGQNFKLSPGNLGDWLIFIQSTSVNRKLIGGTRLVYYKY